MKGGTQALHIMLKSDDRILSCEKSTGELRFFDYSALRRGKSELLPQIEGPIPRQDLRDAFVALLMKRRKRLPTGKRDISRDENRNKLGVSASYLRVSL